MANITQARKKSYHAQKQAAKLRDEMLEEMARDCITHGNSDITTNHMIKRLRLIVIVEADMNATLKSIWNHCLVPNMEKQSS
eukprot:14487217-Ditylum_brightwellii.AAC.1